MKLLLTSAGITNKSILKSLETLLNKSTRGVKTAFVPTAANIESGEKSWLINDLWNLQKVGLEIDLVDISALSTNNWFPRLNSAEVLVFGGGNTFHLMHWMKKSGLNLALKDLLVSKIYVGISAGSCITGMTIYNPVQNLFDEKYDIEVKDGLGLVPFQFIPHLNSPYFDKIREKNLQEESKNINEPIYALDDNSALQIIEDKVKIISEGSYLTFNLN